MQRAVLRPRPRLRARGRAGGRRGPLHGVLEPRLHAVRARCVHRRAQGRLRDPRRAAEQEHRHRHGHGADGRPAAGRGQPLRDRPDGADPAARGRAGRQDLRRALRPRGQPVAPRRRAAAGHRRPRPVLADAHRRRRDPRQRRSRLRAAPPAAPGDPLDAPARLRRRRTARTDARRPRLHGAVLPRAGHRLRPHRDDRVRRGGGVRPHPHRGHDHLRGRGRRDPRGGGEAALRPLGLPAARHLRVPDRPHPGDGGRAGPVRRRGRVPPADDRAAPAGQGRQPVQEVRARRQHRVAPAARAGRDAVHRLRRARDRDHRAWVAA